MDAFAFRAFCFIILLTIVTADGIEFTRQVNNKTLRYIRRNWDQGTYNETSDWCTSIGGRLPMLHTPEDLDYLASTVVGHSRNDPHLTWLGSSVSPREGCRWTDGTPIETFHAFTTEIPFESFHTFFRNETSIVAVPMYRDICQPSNRATTMACPTESKCCALCMWTDSDFKKLTIRPCTEKLWQVCVIEELSFGDNIMAMNESIAWLSNEVESIKSSLTEVQSNLRSAVDDLISNQRNLQDAKPQEFQQKFEDLESRLSDALNKTSNIISDKQSSIDNEVKNMAEEFVSFKDQIERRFNMSSKGLQDRMDRMNSTLEKTKSVLENKLSLTEKTMRERINQVSQSANANRRDQTTKLMNLMQNVRKQEESHMKSTEQQYKSLKEMNQRTRNLLYVIITCLVVAVVGTIVVRYKGVNLSELKAKFADDRNIGPNFPSSKSSSSSLIPPYKSGSDKNLTTCV